jgi:hypothetical protein
LVSAFALALAIVAALPLVADRQKRSAEITEIVNEVDAHPRPKDEWEPAVVGMAVYGGGQVRTHADSAALLELPQGIVRLSAETLLTLKERSTRKERAVTTLFLERGRIWVNLTARERHLFTVETNSAVAVVRDTRSTVQVVDGRTLVSVAEGEVELTAQDQTVVVSAGQQAQVDPGQPPSVPEPGPVDADLSKLSGQWVSAIIVDQQSAECFEIAENNSSAKVGTFYREHQWSVTHAGEVSFKESPGSHWEGTVGADMIVTLVHTYQLACDDEPRTFRAYYEGQIRQEKGTYRLEMSAVEDWCPPCRTRAVYSVVKEQ